MPAPGPFLQPLAHRLIGEHFVDAVGYCVRVVRIHQECGIAGHFRQRRDVGRDDRRAAGHRLERRQAESFVQRREHEHAGQAVSTASVSSGRKPRKPNVFVQLVLMNGTSQRRVFRDLVADQDELELIEVRGCERCGTPRSVSLEVLVRLDVARVQHELVVELVAFCARDDVLFRGSTPKRSS